MSIDENVKPCCDLKPQEYITKNGLKIIVPHFFTPNGDGVNDYFGPILDRKIGDFIYLSILYPEEQRDTVTVGKENIGFVRGFGFTEKQEFPDWYGLRRYTDSLEYTGKFDYEIGFLIYEDGKVIENVTLTGSACAVRCEKDSQDQEILIECLLENSIIGLDIFESDDCLKK